MEKVNIKDLLVDSDLNLTVLRKDIFNILFNEKEPLSAYEILAKLKKIRPNAEPPTVYRVLAYLIEKKLIHRIESNNQYVCCSLLSEFKNKYHGILFICDKCLKSFEYLETNVKNFLEKFSKKNNLFVKNSLIELKGICHNCM
jgi:Fur family zinc uptake transcriptional regulator